MASREEPKRRRIENLEDMKHRMFDVTRGSLESFKEIVLDPALDDEQRKILLNSVQDDGWTVLHLAANENRQAIVTWLLSDAGRAAGFDSVLAKTTLGRTVLQIAAWNGHLECCKSIVNGCRVDNGERHEMLNAVDDDKCTVLHHAACVGDLQIVTWLLSDEEGGGRAAGFESAFVLSDDAGTALHEAVQAGHFECGKSIVNGCRVENGERHEMLNAVNNIGWTVLHYATCVGDLRIVTWLLSDDGRASGFDSILATSKDGCTALHLAADHGSLECCKAIVNGCREDNGERHAMLNAVNNIGWTVLHHAACEGDHQIVTWLLSDDGRASGFDNVLATSKDGCTALHLAAKKGLLECCKAIVNGCREDTGERHEMLNAVDNDGLTVLHHAADYGRAEIVTWLLTEGVDTGFDRKNITALAKSESSSALHFAAISSADAIQALLSHCNNEERMNLFLTVDYTGWSALHYAARTNNANVASELLEHPECSLIANRKDNCGMTVLHRSIIGGIDEKSRDEWGKFFEPTPSIIKALLGSPIIDPNIGLCLQ